MTLTTVAVPDAVADAVVYFAAVVAVARLDRKQFPLVNLPLMQITSRAECYKNLFGQKFRNQLEFLSLASLSNLV